MSVLGTITLRSNIPDIVPIQVLKKSAVLKVINMEHVEFLNYVVGVMI